MAMTKSGIEWCDYTWNPVTGCLHGCPYCAACGNVWRFSKGTVPIGKIHELTEPWEIIRNNKFMVDPYPFGFDPTFKRYKLDEPSKVKKPSTIFVVFMGDLFGEWVPDEWIESVFAACLAAPQHRYLFLTKNPKRYVSLFERIKLPNRKNFWYGSTATDDQTPYFGHEEYNTFLSLEPLFSTISWKWRESLLVNDWVIIGRDTSPSADRSIPKREWVENIVAACKNANVPVFMKSNLAKTKRKGEVALFDESELIQQYPWERS